MRKGTMVSIIAAAGIGAAAATMIRNRGQNQIGNMAKAMFKNQTSSDDSMNSYEESTTNKYE